MYLQLHIKIKKINLSKVLQVQNIIKTRWKQDEKQRENFEFITIDIDEWEFIINYSYRVEEGYEKLL